MSKRKPTMDRWQVKKHAGMWHAIEPACRDNHRVLCVCQCYATWAEAMRFTDQVRFF